MNQKSLITTENVPSSVYRLQLGKNLPLHKATRLISYLSSLGVEGIYCSPIFQSSESCYDITDPNRLNPELGTEDDFEDFCSEIHKYGMKCILDIIPNHMGTKGNKNIWWNDILEKGPKSAFAEFFDINWSPAKTELRNKVLVPVQNKSYGSTLEKNELYPNNLKSFPIKIHEIFSPMKPSKFPRTH